MSVESTAILKNHYEWCKENGRDTSWYKKKKKGTPTNHYDDSWTEEIEYDII